MKDGESRALCTWGGMWAWGLPTSAPLVSKEGELEPLGWFQVRGDEVQVFPPGGLQGLVTTRGNTPLVQPPGGLGVNKEHVEVGSRKGV